MTERTRSQAQVAASFLMALSIFALSAALIYFAYVLSRVGVHLPDILDSVNQTRERVEPVLDEVSEIRKLVPDILHEVEQTRLLVPPILEEVEQTRQQIPPILEQVERTGQQIPPILKEVEAVRKEVPSILKSADKASDAVVTASKEIEATRPLIQDVVKEIETTRESIPPMLDRAEGMIDKAKEAGQEASSGAVTGFFKGLITTPFTLVGDATTSITGMSDEELQQLTQKDRDLIEVAALYLLNNGKEGDIKQVSNPDSGFTSTMKLLSIDIEEEDFTEIECRILQYEGYKDGSLLKTVNRSFCKEEGGGWDLDL
ncbi:MAG: hypothetical protein JSW45_00125 [Thiotrichales bacterium]|nr:MAG: hypothetical protein JSW45_00125 [Thiotrichales bacterium]